MAKSIKLPLAAGYKKITGKEVTIEKGSGPRILKFKPPGLFASAVEYQVITIEWQEQATRSAGKAAAGAVVRGLLTGGVGLLAGAALGGKKKDVSTAVIRILDQDQEAALYVRCKAKDFEKLTALL